MYKNSPSYHANPEECLVPHAPQPMVLARESVSHAVLRILIDGVCEQMGREWKWTTAEELIDSWKRREPRRNESLWVLFDILFGKKKELVDVKYLDGWLEGFIDIEYHEQVLCRSGEVPFHWGVHFTAGEDVSDADRQLVASDFKG